MTRTTRRVSLTDPGRRYLDRGRRLLAEFAEAETEARGERAAPRGTLRVNGPVSFSRARLGAAIPSFLAKYPDLVVELTVNDRMVDLIEEGFDVAVRIGRLADSTLVARRLADVTVQPVASPGYLAAHGTPTRPEELAGHCCLAYDYSGDGGIWRFSGPDGQTAAIRPRGALRANNGDILVEAALGGAGIAVQPGFILDDHLATGRLVRVLPEWNLPGLALHAVHHQNRHVAAKVRAFVDHLVDWFRD
ncbi:MAG: LysR family transcriptional regulator [Alphaproteobacteria bacterium]|nr:LysR family transcriptional regulator [Alphaproteobacteria bacterium]